MKWYLFFVFLCGILLCSRNIDFQNRDKLVFCNVGQGDGALIKYKGRKILIDTGPANNKILRCLSKNINFWDRKIDVVFISHTDNDHNGGLDAVISKYKIGKIYSNDKYCLENTKICIEKTDKNDTFEIGNIKLKIIKSGVENLLDGFSLSQNNKSVVLLLSIKNKKILFTGDMEKEDEEKLIWRDGFDEKIDILKVAHHGSNGSSSEVFLEKIKPNLSIISVGKNNFGHPDKETIKRLVRHGSKIIRTDKGGDAVIYFD